MNDALDKVTEDDVRNFLDAKKAALKCEVCGASQWLIAPGQTLGALRVADAICGNCGYVRSHLLSVVQRWKSKGN